MILEVKSHNLNKLSNLMKNIAEKDLMKISRMVYKLEPFKDFILASEVKVDHRGQQ